MQKSIAVLGLVGLFCFCAAARAVDIAWSQVGDPGNAPSPFLGNPGAVDHTFNIGTYDVTFAQYAEFLNAKDPTGANTLRLYLPESGRFAGITFDANNAPGTKYVVVPSNANHPATFVSWNSAARFANWLNNGQGDAATETGAYTLDGTPNPSNFLAITRNPGAKIFLPNIDEMRKAAYYDRATSTWLAYPNGSDSPPTASAPPGPPNSANFDFAAGGPTDVGAYVSSASPYGAFDMGTNVTQFVENISAGGRALFGTSWAGGLEKINQTPHTAQSGGSNSIGFRVASVPEPTCFVLGTIGLGAFFAFGCYHRKRL